MSPNKLQKRRELEQRGVNSPWVFYCDDGAAIRDFRKSWKKACIAAGVPGRRIVHDFRRTAVRNLERAVVSRGVAMKLTGHLTESVYRRYAIVCESDLAEAVTKLQIIMNLPAAASAKASSGIVSGIVAHVRVQNSNSQLTADLAVKP